MSAPTPSLGYSQQLSVKVVRTKHDINVAPGIRVSRLVEWLGNISPEAEIDEIFTDDDSGITTIRFHDEAVEGK